MRSVDRMRTSLTAVCAVAMLAAALPAGALGKQRAAVPLAEQTRAEVQAVLADGTPGTAVLVRDARGRTQRIAAGRGRLSPERPLGTNARFRAGSVTKTFVAAAVLRRVERRDLRLSDSVERWLPGLLPEGRRVSVRMLLNHTSGLAEYATNPSVVGELDTDPTHAYALSEIARRAVRLPRAAAPGAKFAYANTNYVLLGLILERVTRRSWTTEVRTSILRPLRLRDTALPVTADIAEPFVHGYVPAANGELIEATTINPSFAGSAGVLTSTLTDLATFYRALLAGEVLGRKSLREMRKTSALTTDGAVKYGLGLFALQTRCGPMWGHDGELLGTRTFAFSSPRGDRQVVAVFNRTQASAESVRARLALVEKAYCVSR